MDQTSLSLLYRLRQSPEAETWNRLAGLYTPLLLKWLQQYNVQTSDADDLIQEVLLAVSKDVQSFDHAGRPGAFRAWLKGILINRLRNHWRARDRRPEPQGDSDFQKQLAQLEDPTSELSQIWNREHDQFVLRQLLSLVKPNFETATWEAFERVALEGQPADETAKKMGISLNAVFIAKFRILSRLRREAAGLVDSSTDFFPKS